MCTIQKKMYMCIRICKCICRYKCICQLGLNYLTILVSSSYIDDKNLVFYMTKQGWQLV